MAPHLIRRTVMVVLVLVVGSDKAAWCQTSSQAATVRRADGYKGIWFTLGQFYGKGSGDNPYTKVSGNPVFPYGDKYSGGLGTYTAKHTPLAIYCADVDKTFFVYGGTTGPEDRHLLCMISYYDHQTGQVPCPVVVHDKEGVDDPHDNPSLAIDDEGHVWVFVSGRGTQRPGWKYRSRKPYDLDGFELIGQEEMTYPQPHVLPGNGFLHLFTKYSGIRELYIERSEKGFHWTEDRKLAGIRESGHQRGGHYQTSARYQQRVGTFFNRHPNGNVDQRTDVYYAETADGGKTWTSIQNEKLDLPIIHVDSPSRVHDYAAQGLNVYLKNMEFDHDGHPVLLYVTSGGHRPGPPDGPRHFRITRWDGQRWQSSTICPTDHNYDMGSLVIEKDRWLAWLPSKPGPQPHHGGGEVTLWESGDQGNTWQPRRQVTFNSASNHNYVRRVMNAKDPFSVFWADGDPTRLSKSQLYFSDALGENVWRLPYQMHDRLAKPERVIQTE